MVTEGLEHATGSCHGPAVKNLRHRYRYYYILWNIKHNSLLSLVLITTYKKAPPIQTIKRSPIHSCFSRLSCSINQRSYCVKQITSPPITIPTKARWLPPCAREHLAPGFVVVITLAGIFAQPTRSFDCNLHHYFFLCTYFSLYTIVR